MQKEQIHSRLLIIALLLLWFSAPWTMTMSAQNAAHKGITMNMKSVSVKDFFAEVKKQTGLSFIYSSDLAKEWPRVTVRATNKPSEKVIEQVANSIGCDYSINGNIVTITKEQQSGRERVVNGYVRDESGLPLAGVPICIGETRVCTVTDDDGFYKFNIPVEKTTLKYSYVGMDTEYLTIAPGSADIKRNLTMRSGAQLNDVVVVGYGTTKRKDLTGSVATVDPSELVNAPALTIDDALAGKAAGVMVTKADGSPGGAVRIRIRGGSSLQGGVDPLYVIDGIPMEITNNYISSTDVNNPLEWANYGEDEMGSVSGSFMRGLNSLAGLNINDIETISIMKDASATAIYGSKAANGVVIITTKRGRRDQKPVFTVGYSIGVTTPVKEKLLNGDQYLSALETAITNSNSNLAANIADGSLSASRQTLIDSNNELLASVKSVGNANTDWLDAVLRTGVTHNLNFSVAGGGNASRYYTSFNYTNQEGTLIGTDFSRFTGNVSMDNDITSRFRTFLKLNLSYSKNNISSGVYGQALSAPPILPIYNEDGSYASYDAIGGVGYSYIGYQNPVAVASGTNQAKTYGFNGSFSGEYDILKELKFKSMVSVNYTNYNQVNYVPSYVLTSSFYGAEDNGGGVGTQAQSTSINTFWENTLTYNHQFNENHSLNAVLGTSWEQNTSSYFSATGKGYPDDDFLNNLSSASTAASVAGSNPSAKSSLLSFYGRANYTFMDRYLLTVTGRTDTSSKFAKSHRTGFFPSAAVAWRMNQESWLSDVSWIDEIKLRASIGKTGTQNISDWMFLTLYTPDSYAGSSALYPSQLGNDDIRWESTTQKDLGLDFSFFKGRLSGTLGYYYKMTDGALLSVTPAPSSGFSTVISNIAKISNRGVEFEVNGDIIRTRDWKWSASLNISHNESKVEKILDDQFSSATDRNALNLGTSLIREGESLGLLCGRVTDGVIKDQADLDDYKSKFYYWSSFYRDLGIGSVKLALDEDGMYYEDVIGNCTPDFYGGFTHSLSYKNWSLMAAFTFSYGNDLIYQKDVTDMSFGSLANRSTRILDAAPYGVYTGKVTSLYNSTMFLTDLNVYDASYLKLQTLSLAYNLTEPMLKRLHLTNCQIYATASNLFTITKYPGPDPAVSDDPYSISGGGRDISAYPTVKSFSFGVRIGF